MRVTRKWAGKWNFAAAAKTGVAPPETKEWSRANGLDALPEVAQRPLPSFVPPRSPHHENPSILNGNHHFEIRQSHLIFLANKEISFRLVKLVQYWWVRIDTCISQENNMPNENNYGRKQFFQLSLSVSVPELLLRPTFNLLKLHLSVSNKKVRVKGVERGALQTKPNLGQHYLLFSESDVA